MNKIKIIKIPPLSYFRKKVSAIKNKCENPNNRDYRWYGGRGIKCCITADEICDIWIRDKAISINKPALDRIDSRGNYEYKNCRFISCSANSARLWFNKGYNKKIPKAFFRQLYGIAE